MTNTNTPIPETLVTSVGAPVADAPVVDSPVADAQVADAQVADATTSVVEAQPETTLLAEAPKEDKTPETAEKTSEAPKDPNIEPKEAPKEESKQDDQSEEPAPPPVFEAFAFPEGVTPKEETLKEFTGLLTALELEGKADHAKLQEFGQKAVDFHQKEIQRVVDDLNTLYQKTWNETKTRWKEQFLNDPELGGNHSQTTINSALSFIRNHGGTPEQQAEFRTLMDQSGLGNHPIMIRLLANAGRVMVEGKPLAAQAPPQAQKSRIDTMYGQKKNYIS